MENETKPKNIMDIVNDCMEDSVIESMRKKSKNFNAIYNINGMLCCIAQNRISPESRDGKHMKVELESAIEEYNDSFKEKGINLNLSLDWNLE